MSTHDATTGSVCHCVHMRVWDEDSKGLERREGLILLFSVIPSVTVVYVEVCCGYHVSHGVWSRRRTTLHCLLPFSREF